MTTIDELEALTAAAYKHADPALADELRPAARGLAGTDSARGHAVVGGALLVCYKLGQHPDDLIGALEHLEAAYVLQPTPSRGTNLASALLESGSLPGRRNAGDVTGVRERAIALLEAVVAETDSDEPVWVTRAVTLLGALLDRVEAGDSAADLQVCVDLGERVLRQARAFDRDQQEPANLLGSALRMAFDRGHPAGDIDRAVGLLREAVEGTPWDHPDLPARSSNLGSALIERFEAGSHNVLDLADAVAYSRQAHDLLRPDEPGRILAANNLLNALLGRFTYTAKPEDAHEALDVATRLYQMVDSDDAFFPIIASNTGMAERAVHLITGDLGLARKAVEHQSASVAASAPSDPMLAGRLASLALARGDLYHRTGDPADLDEALVAGRRAVRSAAGPLYEIAGFHSNLANLQHDRFKLTGRIEDLEEAVTLHEAGLHSLPDGHALAGALLNNAGTAFSDRFDRLGDPEDLMRAIAALHKSLAVTAEQSPDRGSREVNMAVSLHRLFGVGREPAVIDAAEAYAERALKTASHQTIFDGAQATLADISLSRHLHLDQDDGRLAATLGDLEADLDQREKGDPLRPARMLRVAVIRRVLGRAGVRERLVEACENGLAKRPEVTLAAARQLAMIGLEEQTNGDHAATGVIREAAEYGSTALGILAQQDLLARELSWRREARGLAAIAAQSRLLLEDGEGARDAFESGHGVVLESRLTGAGVSHATSVTVWATDFGGGAVLTRPNGRTTPLNLPGFTTAMVEESARRISGAAAQGLTRLESELHDVLIGLGLEVTIPISRLLEPDEPLVWSAGGMAARLPYSAAPAHDRDVFISRHSMRFAVTRRVAGWAESTAADTALDWSRAWSLNAPHPSALPPLPGAEPEGRVFGGDDRCLTGSEATVKAAEQAVTQASLLHFACHASTSALDPLANHLVLAGDEPWYAEAVSRSSTNGLRLAILSACDTAAVGTDHADEGLGLASAFHLAGVPGVIATLWSVRDHSTSTLMQSAGTLMRSGTPPVDALRTAMSGHAEGHPTSAWAPFVYLGA